MKLSALTFQHDFVDSLPGDPSLEVVPRQVKGAAYSLVTPEPVRSARILGWSEDIAARFGLSRADERGEAAEILSGNRLLPGMKPYAACYGGHQFGNWAGQLGDGRAITLGEVLDTSGQSWELQLKGAGPTPYSRRADGRAVLRSSIREFVCSEAMHNLGVPTTRALSVVSTGEEVIRDMFYDGNPTPEPGAVVCRLSPTFVRFGNFEIFAARGELELLRKLTDYVLTRHYPHLGKPDPDAYVQMFRELSHRTAVMISHWMRVGFVHGVMNTDNMSILGLTIDYGPYGWLEGFDPSWTPNTTDLPGRRYCYGRQPSIAVWNLAQLARALAALVPDRIQAIQEVLDGYGRIYEGLSGRMMSDKLGIEKLEGEEDGALFQEMTELLQLAETDMTIFFRGLSGISREAALEDLPFFLLDSFYEEPSKELSARWMVWLEKYRARVKRDGADPELRRSAMNLVNPLYVPRNYLLTQAIEAAEKGDSSEIGRLMEVLRHPYQEQVGKEAYAAKRPEWARHKPGCSTLSCSS